MKFSKYILEISVFICGAVVMIFELVGSRVLAPYFGTSIVVWTSLIGIILGSLSIGYYLGGKISDKRPRFSSLSLIIFLAGIIIGITTLFKDPLLYFLFTKFESAKAGPVIASLIIFLPASLLLGMVSPYAAKLRINNLDSSGSAVGSLYAVSTTGSIVGTFLSGFYLIPHFGTNKLLFILALSLLIVSAVISEKKITTVKLLIFTLVLFSWGMFDNIFFLSKLEKKGLIDVDTAYNRIWVYDYKDQKTNNIVRVMQINGVFHSIMALDNNELVDGVTPYYNLSSYFNPNFKKALMIGGGGYSYPKDFLRKYPSATIDVVEIDAVTTQLARKYFNLKENPRLKIFHEDGRVYLNKTKKIYDVIINDAYTSKYSIPYQLTTIESIRNQYNILSDNGVVVVNIISAIEGDKGQFIRAEYATYKSVFPQVYLFPVDDERDGSLAQNVILAALKSDVKPDFRSADVNFKNYLRKLWKNEVVTDMPILTDDYAPVDYYINKII